MFSKVYFVEQKTETGKAFSVALQTPWHYHLCAATHSSSHYHIIAEMNSGQSTFSFRLRGVLNSNNVYVLELALQHHHHHHHHNLLTRHSTSAQRLNIEVLLCITE